MFMPDELRTGSYTLGKDKLLVNAAGESTASYADYVVAMIDKIEQLRHIRQRFTTVSR